MSSWVAASPLLTAALSALACLLMAAFFTWLVSLAKRDVSIVDSLWSLMIFAAGAAYALTLPALGTRAGPALTLLALWALRLAGYLTWRNWGADEDRRYRAIRARNEPNFQFKSLYLVFMLQAVLAWIVSWPLLAALASQQPLGWLDALGGMLVLFGFGFETLADAQLARFTAQPENAGRVLCAGLWRYTRHPNYFGEFCLWWGFFLIALAGGGAWSVISPLLMSALLLQVSGVTLLEIDIADRRPAYRDYVARTNAFFPGRPR